MAYLLLTPTNTCLAARSTKAQELSSIDFILVEKEKRKMSVYQKGKLLKEYKIALGSSPKGHKKKEGDCKTPEGTYFISSKNDKSRFHLSLKVSYPNKTDEKNALKNKVSAGGDIMIHGLGSEFGFLGKAHVLNDWTLGCIALTNQEIEEIFTATSVGTKIEIRP
jgi:murein L,D-transpeptidase YafK